MVLLKVNPGGFRRQVYVAENPFSHRQRDGWLGGQADRRARRRGGQAGALGGGYEG